MSRIRIVHSIKTLLRGTVDLFVVAPQSDLEEGTFLKQLPEEIGQRCLRLVVGLRPGGIAVYSNSLPSSPLRKLTIAMLPDRPKEQEPAQRRADLLHVLKQFKASPRRNVGLLFCLNSKREYAAVASSVAESLPIYTGSSSETDKTKLRILATDASGEWISAGPVVMALLEKERRPLWARAVPLLKKTGLYWLGFDLW